MGSQSMKMRQSLSRLEQEFEEQAAMERHRRDVLRRQAVTRTHARRKARVERHQRLRFIVLMLSIVLTVVVVTVAMFETLTWLMG